MKNKTYLLILIVFSFNHFINSQNIPDDFLQNKSNVTSRGNYINDLSLATETCFRLDSNNELKEDYKSEFTYTENECISTHASTYSNRIKTDTYQFSSNSLVNFHFSSIDIEGIYSYNTSIKKPYEIQFFQPNHKVILKISYENDKVNNWEFYVNDDPLPNYADFSYNSNGYISTYTRYRNDDTKYYECNYVYDNDNVTEETYTYFDSNGNESSVDSKLYQYDYQNRLLEKIRITSSRKIQTIYSYDVYNNRKSETHYTYESGTWKLTGKTEYIFNYDIDLKQVNLPPSEVYVTLPYSSYEIDPIHYKQFTIPEYEKGTFKNFIEKINNYKWENSTWIKTEYYEYELQDDGTLSTDDPAHSQQLLFKVENQKIILNIETNTFEIYNTLGQKIKNGNITNGIYILKITTTDNKIISKKILVSD